MNTVPVALGEVIVSKNPEDVLVSYGLGSCVAVCLYDIAFKIGGMFHCVLPYTYNGAKNDTKYADKGIPALLEKMKNAGAKKFYIAAKIAGGASVLKVNNPLFDVGNRNIEAVKKILKELSLDIISEDVGNHISRTVRLHVADGRVVVVHKLKEKQTL